LRRLDACDSVWVDGRPAIPDDRRQLDLVVEAELWDWDTVGGHQAAFFQLQNLRPERSTLPELSPIAAADAKEPRGEVLVNHGISLFFISEPGEAGTRKMSVRQGPYVSV
jgi:hypothetical protein